MKVGNLVRLKPDIVKPEWSCAVGMIIKGPDPSKIYTRHVTVLWPKKVETLSVKWLEVINESG